jgi:hypothetical protein
MFFVFQSVAGKTHHNGVFFQLADFGFPSGQGLANLHSVRELSTSNSNRWASRRGGTI